MAAYDVEPGLHLLSRRRKARRDPREFASRRRRARPPIAGSMRSTTPSATPTSCGELKSLIEFDHELWAELMRDMLLAANLAVDKAAQANPRGRIKHRPGHNLLQRLKTFEPETLRFLTDFDVPFTNNLA